jgi:hypothetical protein
MKEPNHIVEPLLLSYHIRPYEPVPYQFKRRREKVRNTFSHT